MAKQVSDLDVDAAILDVLVARDAQRPWSLEEVAREIGSSAAASDSIGRLERAGMIHRLGDFVFASRAALSADQIMRCNTTD